MHDFLLYEFHNLDTSIKTGVPVATLLSVLMVLDWGELSENQPDKMKVVKYGEG